MKDTLAVLGGFSLGGVFVLTVLVAALVSSERLLVISIGVIEALLLVWMVSWLWWSA